MAKLTVIIVMVFVLAGIGGALFLGYWNFQVPSTPVEKVLPDARFPR
jgi:ABC-type transporter Mla subunit MlaD